MKISNQLHSVTNAKNMVIAPLHAEIKYQTAEFVLKNMQHMNTDAQIAIAIKHVLMCQSNALIAVIIIRQMIKGV